MKHKLQQNGKTLTIIIEKILISKGGWLFQVLLFLIQKIETKQNENLEIIPLCCFCVQAQCSLTFCGLHDIMTINCPCFFYIPDGYFNSSLTVSKKKFRLTGQSQHDEGILPTLADFSGAFSVFLDGFSFSFGEHVQRSKW